MKNSSRLILGALMLAATVALQAADVGPVRVAVAAQPIAAAINELSRQSGLHIVIDSRAAAGVTSSPVEGMLTAEAALTKLLENTGLEFEYLGENSVAVVKKGRPIAESEGPSKAMRLARVDGTSSSSAPDEESTANPDDIGVVTVFGRGARSSTREIPQTVTVFGADLIKSIAPASIRDIVRLIPSSSVQNGQGSSTPDFVVSRGFGTTFTINGQLMPSIFMLTPDIAGMESVEVLMGPASVQYGTMEPGAVINMVTKKPTRDFRLASELELGSYNRKRMTLDVGGPFSDRVRARLNLAYETRESFYDLWQRERIFVAPVVDFDLTDRTTLTFEAWHQQFTDDNGAAEALIPIRIALLPDPLGEVPEHFTYAESGLGDYSRKETNVRLSLSHELNDDWRFTVAANYDKSRRNGIIWSPSALAADQRTVSRLVIHQAQEQPTYIGSVGLNGQVRTGWLTHRLTMGADYQECTFEGLQGVGVAPALDIFDPVYGGATDPVPNRQSKIESNSYGVFAQDRVAIGRFSLLGGLRWTNIESLSASAVLPTPLPALAGVKQDKVSSQLGLTYDISKAATIYASRVTSFVPRGGTTFGGTAFPPESSSQIEVGSKFDLGASGLTGTVALYKIKKPNVLVADPANPGFLVPIGEASSKGAELSVGGRIMPSWIVQTSYGYLKTKNQLGFELPNAPRNTVTLFSRYDILAGQLQGLGFSGTVQYRDEVYPGALGGLQLPDATRVDLALHYTASSRWEFSLNVDNALNERILNSANPSFVSLGEKRTFLARVRMNL